MKTPVRYLLIASLFLAAGGSFLRADPAPPRCPPSQAGDGRVGGAGKVLVLEGDRTLEGDVERVGDQYRVRRPIGETWLPAARVLRLCADNADALNYLRGRTNLNDPDERLRLAQWCIDRGMHEEALVELRAAVQMRPGQALSKHLLERLQQQTAPNSTAPASPPEAEAELPASVDLTVETLARFTTKVQPILMNTCAGCHATGRGGSFKLMRVSDGFATNRKIIQQNLAAVMAQVNAAQPQASRVLTKAVSLHGEMDKSPLANRQAPAYRALEEWVRQAVADNPQLLDHVVALPPAAPLATPPPSTEAKPTSGGFASDQRPGTARTDDGPKPIAPGQSPAIAPITPLTTPEEKAPASEPADPYDPNEFNRQEHPERVKPPPK